jgi:hypothetical protein
MYIDISLALLPGGMVEVMPEGMVEISLFSFEGYSGVFGVCVHVCVLSIGQNDRAFDC